MWNVRGLHRVGSFTAAARKSARYKLDLVGVQEVRWDKGGTVRTGDYNFFYGKETKIIIWEQEFCTPQIIISKREKSLLAIGCHI